MLAVCALAPACMAAAHVANVADAAHDAGVARALGLDAQAWGALDAAVAGLLSAVPIGTRAARAAMGSALVVAAASAMLFSMVRALLGACGRAPRLGPAVAAIATLTATCGAAWQIESVTAGSVTGATLALLPLAILAGKPDSARVAPACGAIGLALGHDALAGACSLAACAALVAAGAEWRRVVVRLPRGRWAETLGWGAAGLVPLVLALARVRASGPTLGAAFGDIGAGPRGSAMELLRAEVGQVALVLAVGGVVLAMLVARARAVAASLGVLAAAGASCAYLGSPAGAARFGAPALCAIAAVVALAGVAMQAIVRAIAGARLPLAQASATMVVVLESAMPVDAADEALQRALRRSSNAAAEWDALAWDELPPNAVVLVTDARLFSRARAAAARGAIRGDIDVVPTFAHGAFARRVLARDAALVPLWRDLELAGSPTEASLSSLATARPLAMAYEPRWGRSLSRHLVPIALFDRFEPEPRGASDRSRALDVFGPKRERLSRACARDPDLAAAAAYLLRARALSVASGGDRDLVGRAIEDLHAFAPDDAVAAQIVSRVVLGKGAPKLDELGP